MRLQTYLISATLSYYSALCYILFVLPRDPSANGSHKRFSLLYDLLMCDVCRLDRVLPSYEVYLNFSLKVKTEYLAGGPRRKDASIVTA